MVSAQNAQLHANIRRHVDSGRIQHLIMLPPFMWAEEDRNLIKAVLCLMASEILLEPLDARPEGG